MAYITTAEFLMAIPPSVALAIFDDNNDSVLDQTTIDFFIARASGITDSVIAPVYAGPFPITQQPVPSMIKEHTLQWTIWFVFERHPEFTRTLGMNQDARYKQAVTLGENLQKAILRIPDLVAQPTPANVGGPVVVAPTNVITINDDGTADMGDF